MVLPPREEAVDVLLLLQRDHGLDRFLQESRVGIHAATIIGGAVERLIDLGDRLAAVLASGAGKIEKLLGLGVVGDDRPVLRDVNEVVRMQTVLAVDVHAFVAIAKREDDAGHEAALGSGGDDGVHALRDAGEVAVRLDVVDQVHAEIVEPEVGDGDAGLEVFQLDHFFLESAELLPAIGDVVRLRV